MQKRYILFPGRHHLLTKFQEEYLYAAVTGQLERLFEQPERYITTAPNTQGGKPVISGTRIPVASVAERLRRSETIGALSEDYPYVPPAAFEAARAYANTQIIFAVTSADHDNTRRNPVAGHRREAMIERFSSQSGLPCLVYLIDDVPSSERFAHYMVQSISAAGGPTLTPENCVVACSTPEVIKLFQTMGYDNLSVEMQPDDPDATAPPLAARPWDLLLQALEEGTLPNEVHPASVEIWQRYGLLERAAQLSSDPLLDGEGELTETRDYEAYGAAFDDGAKRKWEMLRSHVKPGRIVDIGCGVGSLLEQIAADPSFAESDLYGIEAARPLYEECLHRKRSGSFANPNTFFYQRNLLAGHLFEPDSIDTFLTVSLTHEIYSYLGKGDLLRGMGLIAEQLTPGGMWINLDVVGPSDREKPVWLDFASGSAEDSAWSKPVDLEELAAEQQKKRLASLSSYQSFQQFMHDWRAAEGEKSDWTWIRDPEQASGAGPVIELPLRLAMEWLSKKDYTDNWLSEMHETFCFWTFEDWVSAATAVGLEVLPLSRAFTNEWLVDNRFTPTATLRPAGDLEQALPWPETHMLLACRRPVVPQCLPRE